MTMFMAGNVDRIEVIASIQRRRRWSAEGKARIAQKTYVPGMSVSLWHDSMVIAPSGVHLAAVRRGRAIGGRGWRVGRESFCCFSSVSGRCFQGPLQAAPRRHQPGDAGDDHGIETRW